MILINGFFYYSRPSPMDVLYEEQEFQMNNSYNGKCIYEWNIDGQTDNQIYNQVHRMLIISGVKPLLITDGIKMHFFVELWNSLNLVVLIGKLNLLMAYPICSLKE
ncbi:hypothetical protein RND81_02G153400 [Saponaria officinalis]|uniref:DUF7746 domain-containing protein n=1 Tax=Saponaria officinalis TaxID=3572 RepID=A0AAW1MVH8_SAPOF